MTLQALFRGLSSIMLRPFGVQVGGENFCVGAIYFSYCWPAGVEAT